MRFYVLEEIIVTNFVYMKNVATSLKEFSCLHHKTPNTSFKKDQSAKSGPASQIGASSDREVDGRPSRGANIFQKGQSAKNLAQAANLELSVAVKGRERPTIPSITQYMPKALHDGSLMQCCNKLRRIQLHQNIYTGGANVFSKRVKVPKQLPA